MFSRSIPILMGTVAMAAVAAPAQYRSPVLARVAVLQDTVVPGGKWYRPVASVLVPGLGQLLGGSDRGALYLVVETYLLVRAVSLRRDARAAERGYRDLAWETARKQFGTMRRDTVFEYYETLEEFTESGAFDLDSGDPFVPEVDPTTFNGAVWRLARETFFADPDATPDPTSEAFRQALEFYQERAVGPDFRWSWQDAAIEQDVFREAIRRSDEAFRQASLHLGFAIANHLVAAIDAFASERLSRAARAETHLRSLVSPDFGVFAVSIAF